jgi:cystathionine beta-lyase/cystathionine gamma-synthase
MTPAERERAGISDGLVRVSVGLEDVEDLVEDFAQSLTAEGSSSNPPTTMFSA